jgi:hypothetical protein
MRPFKIQILSLDVSEYFVQSTVYLVLSPGFFFLVAYQLSFKPIASCDRSTRMPGSSDGPMITLWPAPPLPPDMTPAATN